MKTQTKKLLNVSSIAILLTSLVFAVLVFNSPSACTGQWTSCTNAFANDASRATASVSSGANKSGIWNNYGFSIADSSQIDNVTIRTDFFASKSSGFINVKVSGNGGVSFGPSHIVGGNTAEQTFLIDVTNDVSWTGSKLNNSNFKVNVTCFKVGGGSNPTCNLDWAPVNVSYAPFDFSLSLNPNSANVSQGNSVQTTANVTLLGGVSQNVVLSQTNCPPSATCSFNPSSGNPTFSSTFTVNTSVSTPTGVYLMNISGTGDGKTRSKIYTVNVT